MKKNNAHKTKNWKIDPATALTNSLYISYENGPFLATCGGGGAHARRPEVVRDTPPEAPSGQIEGKSQNGGHEEQTDTPRKSQRIPPLKAQNAKMEAPKYQNGSPKGQNEEPKGQNEDPNAQKEDPQGANLNVAQEEMPLNMEGVNFQVANLNVPQEEILLNMRPPKLGTTLRILGWGFRVFAF